MNDLDQYTTNLDNLGFKCTVAVSGYLLGGQTVIVRNCRAVFIDSRYSTHLRGGVVGR